MLNVFVWPGAKGSDFREHCDNYDARWDSPSLGERETGEGICIYGPAREVVRQCDCVLS